MSLETALLLAMLRLARRRDAASLDQLLVRVDADADEARRALASLARAGLVRRVGDQPRLTMIGFALAVATAAAASERRRTGAAGATKASSARPARRPAGKAEIGSSTDEIVPAARIVPLVRRRRAA